MPIRRKDARAHIQRISGDIVGDLGAQWELVVEQLDGDDWSFVIKLHAVVEAALTKAILDTLGDDRLSPIVLKLTFANESTGKLAYARALGLVTPGHVRFMRALARLRNRLAHDVADMTFTFPEFIETLSEAKLREFTSDISETGTHDPAVWPEVVRVQTKSALALAAMPLVGALVVAGRHAVAKREMKEMALVTSEELLREAGLA